jgi:hypothetical protein
MERRPYFLLGDLISNAGVGGLVAVVVALVVGESWPAWLAMVGGMLVGNLVALPAAVGLSVVFGAMELMLPVMVSGMLSGMVVGMRAASGPLSNSTVLTWGAALGLAALLATYALNAYIQATYRGSAT